VGLVAIGAFAVAMAARSPAVEFLAMIFGQERLFDIEGRIVDNRVHQRQEALRL
jgi:hypothetical protein